MPFLSNGQIRYYRSELLDSSVHHGFFSRQGGVSPAPWATLNLGGTVGDDPERVRENRGRALAALGCEPASVYDVWQVHGVDVSFADAPRPPDQPHVKADIILTDNPQVTLMMRFADCVPVLLFDPVRRVAGLAHAGWLGTVRGAVRSAVEAMHSHYGSRPADIQAVIGPSIGPDHYEVGADVIAQVQESFGDAAPGLLPVKGSRTIFDLWAANRLQLENAGVKQIETAGLCTVCHNEDWFSHRGEKGRTGRFGAIIALS
jgi:YfiH family protein